MPIKEIKVLHGTRNRVTMKKENVVSTRHFWVESQERMNKYIERKIKEGWKLEW